MSLVSGRDFRNLNRHDLLDDYVARAKKRKGAVIASALRNRSLTMRDILAHQATRTKFSSEELKERLLAESLGDEELFDYVALAELGRLVLLQNVLNDDLRFAEKLLMTVYESPQRPRMPKNTLRVLIQHLIICEDLNTARKILGESAEIAAEHFGYLIAELDNPFTYGSSDTYEDWLEAFNRIFEENGLCPLQLTDDSELIPFDRIDRSTHDVEPHEGSELVSVVITAFKPKETRLQSSVMSILNQTWQNLELIIVDDASGSDYDALFDRIGKLDSRIKVIKAPENRGTYVARNIGYSAAKGQFIAGQDDDDWSHPQRIAHQVKFMQDNPETIGCRVNAVRCDEYLNRVRVGYYSPTGENASSLMITRDVFLESGGFLETRKAADTEFYYRIAKITGKKVGLINKPLTIIRILEDSLSRSEFSPGWRHSTRRSFRSSYEYWHANASLDALALRGGDTPDVKVPRRFEIDQRKEARPRFDVVLAGDWQQYGGPQKSMLEEIHALTQAGYRVGVMNLEAARFMTKNDKKPLSHHIQKLINTGYVDEVHYDEEVEIGLFILRYPPILQFFTAVRSSLKIDAMVILANQAPSEIDGSDIRYLVSDCHTAAEKSFGISPVWVPQGPQVREFLEYYLTSPVLADFDIPGILDLKQWWHDRLWFRSTIPVVGRHSRDNAMKWPADKDTLFAVYPVDGRFDIRIMGGAKSVLQVLDQRTTPKGWSVYDTDELPVSDFLYSLDYFVFFQHPKAVEAFGRAILEALAAGTLVILPEQFRSVFGNAAVYCEPGEVEGQVRQFHCDFNLYKRQLRRAKAVLREHFSYESYSERIRSILGQDLLEGYTK